MASDNVLNELWELVQKNSKEELDEKSFKEDFSNSVYAEVKKFSKELTNINDEVDRTLLIVLKQAERNPQVLGNSKGNEFSISPAIITKAVKTVKYENRFIPGTVEYENRKELQENAKNLKEVILTPVLINKMLKNYEDLSPDERKKIVDNFSELSYDQRSAFFKASQKLAHKFLKMGNPSKEEQELVERMDKQEILIQQVIEILKTGDEKKIEDFLEKHPNLNKYVKKFREENPNTTIYEGLDDFIKNQALERDESNSLMEKRAELQTLQTLLDKGDKSDIEEINLYKRKLKIEELKGEDLETYINEQLIKIQEQLKIKGKNKDFEADIVENPEELHSETNGAENMGDIESDKNAIEKKEESIKSKNEATLSALNHFIEYFQEFDEETLEEISELTPEEIIANLKDDFNDMLEENKIDSKTKQVLELLADNITSSTKEILLDSKKREEFFEKMQNNFTNKTITDAEISQLFERLSVELQVAQFEPAIEEPAVAENNQSNVASSKADQNAIQSTEFDGILIYNGVQMEVNEEFTKVAIEAQERGEDIQTAILDYYRTKEQEKAETERASEDKEEQAEPEIVVIDEKGEEVQEQETVMQEDASRVADETGEQLQAGDGQHKNVVLIKKGKEGAIQVFRPSSFLKVVKQSEVTFDQVKDEQKELARIVEQERENGEKSSSSKGNGNKSNKSDSYSIDY